MKYSDIIDSLSSATHIYENVTTSEQAAIAQDTWVVKFDGITYIGTSKPVESLATKELIAEPAAPVN